MYERILNVVWVLLAVFLGGFGAGHGVETFDINAMLIGSTVAGVLTLMMLYGPNNWLGVVVIFGFLLTTSYFVFTGAVLGHVLMQGFLGAAFANLICRMLQRKKPDTSSPRNDGNKP